MSTTASVQGQMYPDYVLATPNSTGPYKRETPPRIQKVIHIPDRQLNIGEDGGVYKKHLSSFVIGNTINDRSRDLQKTDPEYAHSMEKHRRVYRKLKKKLKRHP